MASKNPQHQAATEAATSAANGAGTPTLCQVRFRPKRAAVCGPISDTAGNPGQPAVPKSDTATHQAPVARPVQTGQTSDNGNQVRAGAPEAHDQGNYDVGYGKPPKHTRFQKGQSGNAKGRPKGSSNIRSAMIRALRGKVKVIGKGQPVQMSRPDAIALKAIEQAMKGHPKHLAILMQAGDKEEEKIEAARTKQAEKAEANPNDKEIIELYMSQLNRQSGDTPGGGK